MARDLEEALMHWNHAAEIAAGADGERKPAADAFLRLTGVVALGAAWARMEMAADQAPLPARVRAAAQFTRRWLLPECAHLKDIVCSGWDPSEWPDAVFQAP
jgi:hypothetical protein